MVMNTPVRVGALDRPYGITLTVRTYAVGNIAEIDEVSVLYEGTKMALEGAYAGEELKYWFRFHLKSYKEEKVESISSIDKQSAS